MKLQSLLRSIVLAGAAVAGTANAVVVFSEDFEHIVGSALPLPSNFLAYVGPGSLDPFGNWTVTGSVDLIRGAFGAIDNFSIDLSGSSAGAISRSFMTTLGTTYDLTFDLFRNGTGSPFAINLSNTVTPIFSLPGPFVAGIPSVASGRGLSTAFIGTGSLMTLTFGGGAGNAGPTIDNIVLTAVPEPGPMTLILSGLCVVGFLARRRMQSA